MRIRKGYCNALHISPVTASPVSPALVSSTSHLPPPCPTTPTPCFRSQNINCDAYSTVFLMNPRIGIGEERSTITSLEEINAAINESCTETSATSSVSSSSSCQGWWCEEERVFPLKKRRTGLAKFITQKFDKENGKKIKEEEEVVGSSYKSSFKIWRKKGKENDNYCETEKSVRYSKERVNQKSENGGGKGIRVCMKKRKRKRTMLISSILDRTMPLVANNTN